MTKHPSQLRMHVKICIRTYPALPVEYIYVILYLIRTWYGIDSSNLFSEIFTHCSVTNTCLKLLPGSP